MTNIELCQTLNGRRLSPTGVHELRYWMDRWFDADIGSSVAKELAQEILGWLGGNLLTDTTDRFVEMLSAEDACFRVYLTYEDVLFVLDLFQDGTFEFREDIPPPEFNDL